MHAPFRAVVVVSLAMLVLTALAAPTMAEDGLFAGDYVDREDLRGVTHQCLAGPWLEDRDDYLMHVRTTLEPDALSGSLTLVGGE